MVGDDIPLLRSLTFELLSGSGLAIGVSLSQGVYCDVSDLIG